jgi:hypothetical protein
MQQESIQILLIEGKEAFAREIADIIGEIRDYHPISLVTVPSVSDGLPSLDDESVDIVLLSLNPSRLRREALPQVPSKTGEIGANETGANRSSTPG